MTDDTPPANMSKAFDTIMRQIQQRPYCKYMKLDDITFRVWCTKSRESFPKCLECNIYEQAPLGRQQRSEDD